MDQIFQLEELSELEHFLSSQNIERCREKLLELFYKHSIYKNVEEWNKAVIICESLAIVGWGENESVEAVSGKFFNGNPETIFFNRFSESRFLDAIWSKKKNGYTIEQGRTSYHYSPDVPDKKSILWDYPVTECIQEGKFRSQRNWIPKNPILVLCDAGNCYSGSVKFSESVDVTLRGILDKNMRPNVYGSGLDRISFYCSLSYSFTNHIIADDNLKIKNAALLHKELKKTYTSKEIDENHYYLRHRFMYGGFLGKSGTMKIELCLEKEFSELSYHEQIIKFSEYLLQGIQHVVSKLKKQKLSYDFDVMESDLKNVISEWNNVTGANTLIKRPG